MATFIECDNCRTRIHSEQDYFALGLRRFEPDVDNWRDEHTLYSRDLCRACAGLAHGALRALLHAFPNVQELERYARHVEQQLREMADREEEPVV